MAHLYLKKLLQTFLNFELLSLMSLSGPLIFALNLSSLTSAVLILKLTDSPSVLEEVAADRFSILRLLPLVSLVGSLIFALNSSSLRSTQSGANDEGEKGYGRQPHNLPIGLHHSCARFAGCTPTCMAVSTRPYERY